MPKRLLAYFSDEFDDDDVVAVSDLALELAGAVEWTVAPPAFVNESDDSSSTLPEEEPIRTVGLLLPLVHAAGTTAPVRDLAAVVGALSEFSRARGIELELQLDETFVGVIQNGTPDKEIRSLLATWEGGNEGVLN
jgi:hypothetical protein